jgi:hypothetical protein
MVQGPDAEYTRDIRPTQQPRGSHGHEEEGPPQKGREVRRP